MSGRSVLLLTPPPPIIITTDPANYAVNVARDKVIKIYFNQPIILNYTGLVKLKTSSGTIISATATVSGKVLTIKPKYRLAAGNKYLLLIYKWVVTD